MADSAGYNERDGENMSESSAMLFCKMKKDIASRGWKVFETE